VKLLVDMNLSPLWVTHFRLEGVTAVHWSVVGRVDAPDAVIMAYAADHDYVVLTQDLDFGAILAATNGTKPSVVQIRSDNLSPAAIGRQLVAAIRQMTAELEAGALVTVDPARTRLSLLPLNRDPP
jgi:predicted nuclease of predicted toxin-antitoxin system